MVKDQLQYIFDLISNIRISKKKSNFPSPHKYIFLLSLIQIYEKGINIQNKFILNAEIEAIFKDKWIEFFPDSDPDKIFIEYPYFHLTNDGIWELQIFPEKKEIFENYLKQKKRLTKNRLKETVQYGFLKNEFHIAFMDKTQRQRIRSKINELLQFQNQKYEIDEFDCGIDETTSLYTHEATAITQIENAVKSRGLGYVCSNIEIHDPQSNRYFEIDLLVFSSFGIYVVELKHWTGQIKVLPYSWEVNGFSRSDPHKGNNHKAKLIKGICEREYPFLKFPFAESVVILTHPDASTEGCANPDTNKNQPTFDSIGRFVKYLQEQKAKKNSSITQAEAEKIRNYIQSLHRPGMAGDIQFPGYEIVKRLYQSDDRAEVIARPMQMGKRSLMRFRIFFNAGYGNKRNSAQIEKARATLKAIAGIKEHSNVLKVLSFPSQEGHLIEGSDWSEQGTLQDLIAQESPLDLRKAVSISIGILKGLAAIHNIGVIHRNLSPENILMVEDIPKLMNFDLSYQLEDRMLTMIPDPSKLKKIAHTAPEIYDWETDLSENADLFSVGVLLFQMLTGKLPFKSSLDLDKTNGQIPEASIALLKERDVMQEIIDLIVHLTQENPKKRPKSAKEVLNGLEQFVEIKQTGINKQLAPGDRHEQFEIIEFIKKGSESQLYKARGPMGQELFLKLFNFDVPQKRIIREKQMSAAVSHGSIVKAEYCQLWEDKRYMLAFKWIDGQPIHGPSTKDLPTLDLFYSVAATLLKAFIKLHTFEENDEVTSVLHNDIKPDNILLTNDLRPMLIDFGIASHPKTGLYSGTAGYVPPDSISGEDREYSVQGDLFGLGVTLFEWVFGKKPYERLTLNALPINMRSLRHDIDFRLENWFLKAISIDVESRFESASQMQEELQKSFEEIDDDQHEDKKEEIDALEEPERIAGIPLSDIGPNPFVAYLNTLHNRDAGSGNALAESQACNKWFGYIHVEHPLTQQIFEQMVTHRRHVILTGHAGDGKSTIGLELYKKLKNLPIHEKLDRELKLKEDIEIAGKKIAIIKDFSEWSDDAKMNILQHAGNQDSPVMLLISNTGTLLNAFHLMDEKQNRSKLKMENDLLKAFSSSSPTIVSHNKVSYHVINLAMFDNLSIARAVFERMISKERWESCQSCKEKKLCTIYRNVTTLQYNPVAVGRVFLLYRRMFEYRDRFTLRQLIAHMAYMITAGMEYSDIQEYAAAPDPPFMTEFMFFNRMFGDTGRGPDKPARQLQVIRKLISRELGTRPCPSWERHLWLRDRQSGFTLRAELVSRDFNRLRQIGAALQTSVYYRGDSGRRLARQQVRRMLFFLHDFADNEQDGQTYVSNFLNSPMLLQLEKWRINPHDLTSSEKQQLKSRIFHVLQEQFAGIRLPERDAGQKQLYITLNRNDYEMRQGAQVVLADFPSREFQIEWASENEKATTGKYLIFSGSGPFENAYLKLELPFLDYVQMRHQGETGQLLQTSFADRLDYFKAQLIRLKRSTYRDNEMILLQLKSDHTFREYRVIIDNDKLEVMNA